MDIQLLELRPWMIEKDTGVYEMLQEIPHKDEFEQENEFFGLTKDQVIDRIYMRNRQAYGLNEFNVGYELEPEDKMQMETYVMFVDKKPVTMGGFRFVMNDYLLKHCGNIWYKTRPTERNKGYCTLFTHELCEMARKMGYKEVYSNASKENIASNRVLQKNGFVPDDDNPLFEVLRKYSNHYKKALVKSKKNEPTKGEKMVTLHVPTMKELEFRRKLYLDPATMANFDHPFDFDESKWEAWHKKWVGQEPKRFYAYIQNETGEFVGDVNWHLDESENACYIGVVVKQEFRGEGYAEQGLKLLMDEARKNGIAELRNVFQSSRKSAKNLHEKLGFEIIGTTEENGETLITLSKDLTLSHSKT